MKTVLTLIHPSRGRAKKAKATLENWLNKASGKHNIEHILSLDLDDKTLPDYIDEFKVVNGSAGISSNNTCVVEATNKAAAQAKGQILIYLSDDFNCPENWDELIVNKFKGSMDKPALLKVVDCIHAYEVGVLTIPIMNREMLSKLGYFWHPGYRSMFVDEDLYWTCQNNGWLIDGRELQFPHEHCCVGKAERDETYIRSEANWDSGKAFFAERKAQNFPL